MKNLLCLCAMLTLTSCKTHQISAADFQAAPSPIDQRRNPSIEDYIVALPPFSFHEGPVESFAAAVRSARTLPQNSGKSFDYLYVPGDGTWPSKEFSLDQESRLLRINVHPGPEPESEGYTVTMRRVPGGWIRGS